MEETILRGLRSRVFWRSVGLLLLVCSLLALAAYITAREEGLAPQGPAFFESLCFCLAQVHGFLLPYATYHSLAREREDGAWGRRLTGLGPRRLLRGRVGLCLARGGLCAGVVSPFVLFSRYLHGIEWPSLLLVMALGACGFLFLTGLAVCAASLAEGRLGRGLVHLTLLGVLGSGLLLGKDLLLHLTRRGLPGRDELFCWLFVSCTLLMTGWVLFETAVARLSPSTENDSRAPRRALLVQTGLSALLALGAWDVSRSQVLMAVLLVLGTPYLLLCGIALATDVDGQALPPRAATRPWSLLRPGALRGFRLAVVLLLAWAVVCVMPAFGSKNTFHAYTPLIMSPSGLLTLPLYALLYLSLPLWLARLPLLRGFASPVGVRLLFAGLLALGLFLPLLAGNALRWLEESPLVLLNPFVGMPYFLTSETWWEAPGVHWGRVGCLALLTALSLVLADGVLAARERRSHAR